MEREYISAMLLGTKVKQMRGVCKPIRGQLRKENISSYLVAPAKTESVQQ